MRGNAEMSGQNGMANGNTTTANTNGAATGTQANYPQANQNQNRTNSRTGTMATGTTSSNSGYANTGYANSNNALVLVFLNDDAADTLQNGNFTLGDDVNVTSGPTSMSSSSNVSAPVVAYVSNAQGGFTGANGVNGAKVKFDNSANQQMYGNNADAGDMLQGNGNNNNNNNNNGRQHQQLTAFNQALSQFAPSSQYNSSSNIVR
jgi:hypothetical protein